MLLICSFCGRSQAEVAKLIAGPGCYICNDCVDRARDGFDPQDMCSFCGKQWLVNLPVVGTVDVAICRECLGLCNEIIPSTKRRTGRLHDRWVLKPSCRVRSSFDDRKKEP